MTGPQPKELLVYAPVGLAYFLRDTAPTFFQMFVARGRSVVATREHAIDAELARAKSMGQLTVMFGKPELEKRLRELKLLGESLLGEQLTSWWPSPSTQHPYTAPTARPAPATAGAAPEATQLPIPAYDSLAAAQVIEVLDGLSVADRESIAMYEAAHRNRQTILRRIDALRAI